MPVLGARRYVHYIALECIQGLAPALLYPPAPLEEVEHLLSTMDVPERSRAFLEGHPRCAVAGSLRWLATGWKYAVPVKLVGAPLLARYVVCVLEL